MVLLDVRSSGTGALNTNILDLGVAAAAAGFRVAVVRLSSYGYTTNSGLRVESCMGNGPDDMMRAFNRAAFAVLSVVIPALTDPLYLPWHVVPVVPAGTPVHAPIQFFVYRLFYNGFPLLDIMPPIANLGAGPFTANVPNTALAFRRKEQYVTWGAMSVATFATILLYEGHVMTWRLDAITGAPVVAQVGAALPAPIPLLVAPPQVNMWDDNVNGPSFSHAPYVLQLQAGGVPFAPAAAFPAHLVYLAEQFVGAAGALVDNYFCALPFVPARIPNYWQIPFSRMLFAPVAIILLAFMPGAREAVFF